MRTLGPMKPFLILGVLLMFLGGCATVCPKQTVVEMMWTPFGSVAVETGRDTYCEERHSLEKFKKGEGWVTLEEYEAWIAELKENPEEPEQTGGSI